MKNIPATPLFTSSGVPRAALRHVLEICGIEATEPDGIVEITQQVWRKHDLPAAKIPEEDAHLREALLPHFRTLGLIGEPSLPSETGDWGVILGATYVGIHKRLAHAVRLWKKGRQWRKCAFLVSRRPLLPDKEAPSILTQAVAGGLPLRPDWKQWEKLPRTEADLPGYILDQLGSTLPHELQWSQIVIADNGPDGKPAGTLGTYDAFARQCNPLGKHCFVFTSQPHILRGRIEAQLTLGDRFREYHALGYDDRSPETINVTQTLDELAKLIYTLHGHMKVA